MGKDDMNGDDASDTMPGQGSPAPGPKMPVPRGPAPSGASVPAAHVPHQATPVVASGSAYQAAQAAQAAQSYQGPAIPQMPADYREQDAGLEDAVNKAGFGENVTYTTGEIRDAEESFISATKNVKKNDSAPWYVSKLREIFGKEEKTERAVDNARKSTDIAEENMKNNFENLEAHMKKKKKELRVFSREIGKLELENMDIYSLVHQAYQGVGRKTEEMEYFENMLEVTKALSEEDLEGPEISAAVDRYFSKDGQESYHNGNAFEKKKLLNTVFKEQYLRSKDKKEVYDEVMENKTADYSVNETKIAEMKQVHKTLEDEINTVRLKANKDKMKVPIRRSSIGVGSVYELWHKTKNANKHESQVLEAEINYDKAKSKAYVSENDCGNVPSPTAPYVEEGLNSSDEHKQFMQKMMAKFNLDQN